MPTTSPIDFEAYGEELKRRHEERMATNIIKFRRELVEEEEEDKRRRAPKELSAEELAECARIRKQYNLPERLKDTAIPIQEVKAAEEEIAICNACKGLPCQKLSSLHPEATPVIKMAGDSDKVDFRPLLGFYYPDCRYIKAQRLQAKIAKNASLLKIPPEYVGKTFDDYKKDIYNANAVEVAKSLLEHSDKGIYFYGNVGTGKTLLVSIIAQEIIKRGRQVIFTTIPLLSLELRDKFNKTPRRNKSGENLIEQPLTEKELVEKLINVPTLIIDDIGMEKPTRFVCSTVSNIFNERYGARRQTIMTSNYTLEELRQIFNNPSDGGQTLDGTRIFDRCRQVCPPVEIKGESRR